MATVIGGAGAGVIDRAAGIGADVPGRRLDPLLPREGPSFADTLKRALGEVSQVQADAQEAIGAFLRGEPVELHRVMAAVEEAGIALDLLIEVRNKLVDAYRTVINMQA
ncbi:MAG TPA: flagellar hook-basal body complex protein FliE [Longimicrobiales bacterium]